MKLLWLLPAIAGLFALPAAAPAQTRADKVRAQVREILESPEFGVAPAQPSALDKLMERIGKFIEDLFDRLGRLFGLRRGGAGGNIAFWIVLAAMIAAMGWVAAYAMRRLELSKSARRKGATISVEAEPDSNEPADWLALAQSLAASGDFRRAYRAMFRALLLRLDVAGTIRFEPSRTNGEYVRALRSNTQIHGIVRPAATTFDVLWYGRRPATEQDFAACRAAYDSVDSVLA